MPTPQLSQETLAQISTNLLTKALPISTTNLATLLFDSRPGTPAKALTQTALFRLLASDFTATLAPANPANLLPTDVASTAVETRRIPGPVPLQVLDVQDIGCSRWSQVEAIERVERGEETRGREVVRTVVREDGNSGSERQAESGGKSIGPHKLVLQDARGTRVEAFEFKKVEGIAIGNGGMSIGAKMVLKSATVARGLVLLEPQTVTLLGGKIEAMDKACREGKKQRLLDSLDVMDED